jgi:hypothetical protein
MIKKALLILIFQIGYTFSSFALEVNPINIDTLTKDENHKLKISEIYTAITKNFNASWYQEKIYQNNDISVGFFIVLHENGALKHLKMNYVHCGNDTKNECKHFILNVKKNISRAFPMKDVFSSLDYKHWKHLNLDFGSKESNELFKKQIKK